MSLTDTNRGIPDQPGPTCPYIDRAIDSAQEILDHFDMIGQEGVELSDVRVDIEKNIDDSCSHAEEARSNVMEIRSWGQEWKDYALQLEKERDDLQEEKEELEERIRELEEQEEEEDGDNQRSSSDPPNLSAHDRLETLPYMAALRWNPSCDP